MSAAARAAVAGVIARARPALLAVSVVSLLALGARSASAQGEGEESASAPQPETQYVIEQLVVTVNSEPDGAGERVDQIKSGDRVEVLERRGEQALVRLTSGQEGWVRSSYLSTSPPMREQLRARTAELEKLRAEKMKLETELVAARKAAGAAASVAAPPAPSAPADAPAPGVTAEAGAVSSTVPADVARSPTPPMFESESALPPRPSWVAAVTASLLTLIAGFVLGWRVLDKRIRARYGGLRIY